MNSILAKICSKWLSPLLVRLSARAAWWPVGIFPLKSHLSISDIVVNGTAIHLALPEGELDRQQWEIRHLFNDDPYQLRLASKDIRTVVDIGGNTGFFSILSRHYFPTATIHCYEPNPTLAPLIKENTGKLDVKFFAEGVGKNAGRAEMDCAGPTLEGSLVPGQTGTIAITSFHEVIERIGGSVDLLKMDCEGGEWDILEDTDTLGKVKRLAMEYHLDRQPGRSVENLVRFLKEQGFYIDSLREAANSAVGQINASRR